MEEFERAVRYNSLLLIYKNLLSAAQKEILTDYFAYDLSISEIAQSRNVSRAAIEDAIKKGLRKLEEFENELHIFEKNEKIKELLSQLKSEKDDSKKASIIESLERTIDNGI